MPIRIPIYILLSHISGSKWWIVAILDARRSIKASESTLRVTKLKPCCKLAGGLCVQKYRSLDSCSLQSESNQG